MNNRMRMEFEALSLNEALARTAAAAFAAQLDPTVEDIADIRTAVSEAVTNAIVHGYGGGPGVVTLECETDGNGLLTVRVCDSGRGIADIDQAMQPFFTTADGTERSGMGFAVMEAFMDSLDVRSELGRGTVVTMKKRICRRENGEDGPRTDEC